MLSGIRTKDYDLQDCFSHTTPQEGMTYCACCEAEQPPRPTKWKVAVINPKTMTHRVNVFLLTCRNCQAQFDMYGTE